MTERSVTHATFTIERTYPVPPDQVFLAWASPTAKAEWFAASEHELDFRVGGTEINRGGPAGGPVFTYEARYHDIVENERIISTYDMYMGDTRISVSLGTIVFEPVDEGTRLVYTEHGAYLDGADTPEQREGGTGELLDALGALLTGNRASA